MIWSALVRSTLVGLPSRNPPLSVVRRSLFPPAFRGGGAGKWFLSSTATGEKPLSRITTSVTVVRLASLWARGGSGSLWPSEWPVHRLARLLTNGWVALAFGVVNDDAHAHPSNSGDSLDQVLQAVGTRLRALREQRGATLSQVSLSTGISVSTLSRLEAGQRRPTLELLLPLARDYQVTLDELVDVPPTEDPRVRPRPIVHNGMTFVPLTRRPGGLQAYKIIIPPHSPVGEPDQQVHEGYDWFYVLSGRLRLVLGQHDLILTAGEVAEFDTRTPHWLGNPGPAPTEILALFGPHGERMHVRVQPRSEPGT